MIFLFAIKWFVILTKIRETFFLLKWKYLEIQNERVYSTGWNRALKRTYSYLVNKKVVLTVWIKRSRFLHVQPLPSVEHGLQREPCLCWVIDGVCVCIIETGAVRIIKIIAAKLFFFLIFFVIWFLKQEILFLKQVIWFLKQVIWFLKTSNLVPKNK